MIIQLLTTNFGLAAAFIGALVVGITIHEFAHALAGYLMGDTTARDAGRLTLNPLAHLDPMGSLMLLFAGFGWGKPTPYNPYQLRYHRWGPALVALAGPVSNLLGALGSFALLIVAGSFLPAENLLIVFLGALLYINMMLMIFNLIPIPPLDGSQILFTVLPSRYDSFKLFLAKNGPILLFGLIILDSFTNLNIFGSLFSFFFDLLGRFLP